MGDTHVLCCHREGTMARVAARKQKSPIKKKSPVWPVIEIFGPTVQGEGVDQGVVSHFVRFGGCDFRCDWCDTPYAVVPKEVKANSDKMDTAGIVSNLRARDRNGRAA